MIRPFILITTLTLILSGCATTSPSGQSGLSVSPEVRRATLADETLFRDVVGAIGGVGFVDRVLYPKARQRSVIRIEVVTPPDPGRSWAERWHIQHDGQGTAAYLIKFTSDGKGGTFFSTRQELPDAS
jgi:hypothetical protein